MGLLSGDFYSHELGMTTRLNVIVPEWSTDADPVVFGEPGLLFLLHGLGANADEWVRFSKVEYYAKKYNLFVVCPETQRSFYTDTFYGPRYFSWVSRELPKLVRDWFRVTDDREKTYIGGISMGGYGAAMAALAHPETFGACAPISAVLDIAQFRRMTETGEFTDMSPREFQGLFGEARDTPESASAFWALRQRAGSKVRPRIVQACGTDDFLLAQNRAFAKMAAKLGYDAAYVEEPGDHSWPYWDVAVQRAIQLLLGLDPKECPIY